MLAKCMLVPSPPDLCESVMLTLRSWLATRSRGAGSRFRAGCCAVVALGVLAGSFQPALAQTADGTPAAAATKATDDQVAEMISRGVRFLESQQAPDGSFNSRAGLGPTALATLALIRCGRTPKDPVVAKGLEYITRFVQDDGGIHPPRSRLSNYETCVAVLCLQAANQDGKYDKIIEGANRYLRTGIWDEGEGKQKSDPAYGGAGYGGQSRPDLSNTSFLIDALKASGAKEDDEALQKALVFVSRCQNLESEHNTTPFAGKINDGGFYYTPVVGEQGEDRQSPDGGLRSYGAMTYSGLKSMIYAGVDKDDPRVKAAVGWISKYYDLDSNPGMGDAGLYYYYHTFAKALNALGADKLTAADGKNHDWRRDLVEALAKRQQKNGSWVNTNPRWLENDATLVTSFALLALSYCR